MAATLPVCALLSGFATPLIRFMYGARWEPAASALRWLALLGALRVALELAYDFLTAAGRSRATLWLQAGWLAVLVPALAAAAKLGGIHAVALAHVAVAGLLVAPAFLYALTRLGLSVTDLARNCWRPLLAGLFVVATATLAQRLMQGDLRQLAIGGTISTALIAPLLLPMRRPPPPRGRRVRPRRLRIRWRQGGSRINLAITRAVSTGRSGLQSLATSTESADPPVQVASDQHIGRYVPKHHRRSRQRPRPDRHAEDDRDVAAPYGDAPSYDGGQSRLGDSSIWN
jgi:hypothetical protein